MCKIDVESAYRLIPVHPDDYHLLGMIWNGKYYIDLVTPFGLASACQLWEEIATALEWIIRTHLHIIVILHYVDDYFVLSPSLAIGQLQIDMILHLCKILGVPISTNKLIGPTTS